MLDLGGKLLTQTEDVIGRRKQFEYLLNLASMSITLAEVAGVVKKLPGSKT